ncbi:hypothetical protein ACER0C_016095 [Sarotherodon galilaeus]
MKVNIFCCLLVCTLGSNVTAGLTHEAFKEGTQVTVRCPHSVEGNVRWSRESGGSRADILTADGGGVIKHINDPQKRYSSQADRSLIIVRVALSDSGRYFCNHEAAVELTVIPSGTKIVSVAERSSITLNCSHHVGGSAVPTWSRDSGEINEGRISVSTEDKTLSIREAEPADSGLYNCDGKPAVYLTVTKGQRSDRDNETTSATITTTVTHQPAETSAPSGVIPTKTSVSFTANHHLFVLGIRALAVFVCSLVLVIIYFIWRQKSKRRGTDKQLHVYDEIPAGAELHVINGARLRPVHCLMEQPDSPYSVIGATFSDGNKKGSSQPVDNTYFLLEKPKA